MKKYWIFAKITIAEYMAYRMNFFMWRVRQVIQLLIMYFLWFAVFASQKTLFGYTESMMLSYVFLTSLLRTYVLGTTTNGVGEMINDGRLTNFLTRPVSFFTVFIARDVADKLLNFVCSIVEVSVLWCILRPDISIQGNIGMIFFTILASLLAVGMYFYFSLIIGFFGFWTPEIWGPRFLSFIIIEFFSGMMFPLDILPTTVRHIFQYLPFQYLIYFPASIYLGKIPTADIWQGLGIACCWVILLYGGAHLLWRRGLRVYEAQGR